MDATQETLAAMKLLLQQQAMAQLLQHQHHGRHPKKQKNMVAEASNYAPMIFDQTSLLPKPSFAALEEGPDESCSMAATSNSSAWVTNMSSHMHTVHALHTLPAEQSARREARAQESQLSQPSVDAQSQDHLKLTLPRVSLVIEESRTTAQDIVSRVHLRGRALSEEGRGRGKADMDIESMSVSLQNATGGEITKEKSDYGCERPECEFKGNFEEVSAHEAICVSSHTVAGIYKGRRLLPVYSSALCVTFLLFIACVQANTQVRSYCLHSHHFHGHSPNAVNFEQTIIMMVSVSHSQREGPRGSKGRDVQQIRDVQDFGPEVVSVKGRRHGSSVNQKVSKVFMIDES